MQREPRRDFRLWLVHAASPGYPGFTGQFFSQRFFPELKPAPTSLFAKRLIANHTGNRSPGPIDCFLDPRRPPSVRNTLHSVLLISLISPQQSQWPPRSTRPPRS